MTTGGVAAGAQTLVAPWTAQRALATPIAIATAGEGAPIRFAAHARSLVREVAPRVGPLERPCPHGCQRALESAIITQPEAREPDALRRLDAVAGRVLNSE